MGSQEDKKIGGPRLSKGAKYEGWMDELMREEKIEGGGLRVEFRGWRKRDEWVMDDRD
jgi:hypothetical protein